MTRGTNFFLLLFIALMFLGCGDTSVKNIKGTLVRGEIVNAENLQVFFDKILLNNTTSVVASGEIDRKGKFELPIETPQHGIYRLRIGAKSILLALNGNEKLVKVSGDLTTLQQHDYEITGSKEAQIMQSFNKMVSQGASQPAQVKSFADTTSSILTAMLGTVTRINPEQDLAYHKNILTKLDAAYPNSPYSKNYRAIISQVETKLKMARVKVGETALDISLPSPDGKTYTLSDLKGQVVLIDFWASWCRPCRINNPRLVSLYNKYKKQGFTVYSVSLDKANGKQRWIDAIEKDKLTWPYHVSDLKGWSCVPAKEYGVRGIPYTVLVDKEGKIASINPRHHQLEDELKKLL